MRIPIVTGYNELETIVNKALGISGTRGSGSVAGDGDGRGTQRGIETYAQLIAECKYTEKESGSITVRKKDFLKTAEAAARLGRVPAMFRSDADGNVHCVLRLEDFADIYHNHLAYVREKGGQL